MSVRVMTAVWELDLPDSEKIVLLALGDCANDEGLCWPSMATLSKKCSKSDRTVQVAIKALVMGGHLSRNEVPGKGCHYIVHPRKDCAPQPLRPEEISPPKPLPVTPEAASDKPSRTVIPSGADAPSGKRTGKRRAAKSDIFPRPEWADVQVWSDFLMNRKRKQLSNTPTAHKRFLDDIERLSDEEWPPGRLLEHAAARGWGGIYDPRGRDGHSVPEQRRTQGGDVLLDIIRSTEAEAAAEREAQARDCQDGPLLSAHRSRR